MHAATSIFERTERGVTGCLIHCNIRVGESGFIKWNDFGGNASEFARVPPIKP